MGAGHTVTVLYEVVPVGVALPDGDDRCRTCIRRSPEVPAGPDARDRRSSAPTAATASDAWLTVKARYQSPAGGASVLVSKELSAGGRATWLPLASSVAEFGLLLRERSNDASRWAALERRFSQLVVPPGLASEVRELAELVATSRGLARLAPGQGEGRRPDPLGNRRYLHNRWPSQRDTEAAATAPDRAQAEGRPADFKTVRRTIARPGGHRAVHLVTTLTVVASVAVLSGRSTGASARRLEGAAPRAGRRRRLGHGRRQVVAPAGIGRRLSGPHDWARGRARRLGTGQRRRLREGTADSQPARRAEIRQVDEEFVPHLVAVTDRIDRGLSERRPASSTTSSRSRAPPRSTSAGTRAVGAEPRVRPSPAWSRSSATCTLT